MDYSAPVGNLPVLTCSTVSLVECNCEVCTECSLHQPAVHTVLIADKVNYYLATLNHWPLSLCWLFACLKFRKTLTVRPSLRPSFF